MTYKSKLLSNSKCQWNFLVIISEWRKKIINSQQSTVFLLESHSDAICQSVNVSFNILECIFLGRSRLGFMIWGHLKLGVSMAPVSWRQRSWIVSHDLHHPIQTHPSSPPFNDPISWSLWVCKRVTHIAPSDSVITSQSFSLGQWVRKANKPVNQLMGQLDSRDIRQSVSHSVIPALESDSTEDCSWKIYWRQRYLRKTCITKQSTYLFDSFLMLCDWQM